MKKLTKLMLVLAQLGMVGGTHAAPIATISLGPSSQVGNTLSFDVTVDFSDVATNGGLFQINYTNSSLLSDANFSYAALPLSMSPPDSGSFYLTGGQIDGVGFVANAFKSSTLLGTLSFTVLGAGNTDVTLSGYPNFPFLDETSLGDVTVQYFGGSATLTPAAVPVPAALWLMASGLSALGLGLRRRRA